MDRTDRPTDRKTTTFNLLLVTLVVRVPIRTKLIRTVYRLGSWRAGFSSDRNRLRDPSSGLYRRIVNHQSRLGRVLWIALNSTRISGFRIFFRIHLEFRDFGLTRSGKLHRFFLNTKRKNESIFQSSFYLSEISIFLRLGVSTVETNRDRDQECPSGRD
jgi:hypothetical protein